MLLTVANPYVSLIRWQLVSPQLPWSMRLGLGNVSHRLYEHRPWLNTWVPWLILSRCPEMYDILFVTCTTHEGDQTRNIWVSRSVVFPDVSFEYTQNDSRAQWLMYVHSGCLDVYDVRFIRVTGFANGKTWISLYLPWINWCVLWLDTLMCVTRLSSESSWMNQ